MCGARHLMNITSIVPLQSAALLQLKAGAYGLTLRLQALPYRMSGHFFSPDSLEVTLGESRRRVILDRCCFLFMWAFGCWGCLLFVLRCLPSAFPGCSGLWFEMSRSRSHRMYEIEPAIQGEVRPSFDQGILGDRADRMVSSSWRETSSSEFVVSARVWQVVESPSEDSVPPDITHSLKFVVPA